MTIHGMSHAGPSQAVQNIAPAQVSGAGRRDGDREGHESDEGRVHGHRRGGWMGQAMMESLQELGLTLPPAPDAAAQDGEGAVRASENADVRHDLHRFMHALFEALKSEGRDAATTPAADATATPAASTDATDATAANATAAATDPARVATTVTPAAPHSHGFGARLEASLSALITDVANGNAPTRLQQAFDTLLGDLGQANTPPPATDDATAPATDETATVTLKDLLSKLLENLGYDANAAPATGNVVSTVA